MELIQLEAPTAPVLTMEAAKGWLRVNFADEDSSIAALIAAATARFDGRDGVLGRCLMPQTWQLRQAGFPPVITLPLPPTIEVLAIEYIDADGVVQTLTPSAYEVIVGGWRAARITPAPGASWPATKASHLDAVRITFRAGYAPAGSPPTSRVPEPIRHAIMMLVADWFDARGNHIVGPIGQPLPIATEALVAPYRVVSLA